VSLPLRPMSTRAVASSQSAVACELAFRVERKHSVERYRVAQVGLGHRGRVQAQAFLNNSDRFDLVALCELDELRLEEGLAEYSFAAGYTDAETMLAETRPDVFCFVTQPHARLALVELAAKHGVKGLAFEKPMATSLKEAWAIADLCHRHHIKAVVCHQQKYLTSMARLKRIIDEGEIGEIREIHATTQGWLSQLGTHYMDYIMWINGGARARWAVGHVHGKKVLDDSHPSPDYVMGQVLFANGVRAFLECGYLSPTHMKRKKFWVDNRLTVHGTHGYAWADTDGRWGALTRSSGGEMLSGVGDPWERQGHRIQSLYTRDLANWLDDDNLVHPCNIDLAFHGYEVLQAMCLSALDNVRVDLPLAHPHLAGDILERMRRELPDMTPALAPAP